MMREAEVQAAFVRHLLERGWDPTVDGPDRVDVRARRGAERMVAEVKGDTSDPGTDVDTLVGQLLRRIDPDTDERYVLVVTERLLAKVQRIDAQVLARLGIEVAVVDDLGGVRWV